MINKFSDENIIDTLLRKGICFAVISIDVFHGFGTDNFIVAPIEDYATLEKLGFRAEKLYGKPIGKSHRRVCERDLSREEFAAFKKHRNKFSETEVDNGVAYELLNHSIRLRIKPKQAA